jgi:beta-phosphoglucomutase family hydrolase
MTFDIPPDTLGLIFDCDGTIADTMPLHYRAWVAALGEHGVEFPEALFYELAGVPTDAIIRILNDRHGHHMPVRQTAELKDRLSEQFIPEVLPIEPVVQVARAYKGKLPMAVASGGTRVMVHKTLGAVGLLDMFDAVVTAEDVKHGKPAPDIFLEAARRLGIPPGRCVGFEDGELGLQSARAAGMVVIDVRPAYRNAPGPPQ